jgi:transposase
MNEEGMNMRPKGSPEELYHHRQRAIALLEQGLDKGEVARRIGVARRTVRQWHHDYQAGGAAALKPKPAVGAPARLSGEQKSQLAQALIQGAKAAGFDSELWTGPRIARLIRDRFGVGYNEHYVLELLRGLDFTPQRPEPVAQQRDERLKQRWLHWVWPAIKKKGTAPGRVARFH